MCASTMSKVFLRACRVAVKNHAIIGLEDWNTLVKVVPLEIALIPQGALTLRLPDRDQSDFSKFRESHSSLWQ